MLSGRKVLQDDPVIPGSIAPDICGSGLGRSSDGVEQCVGLGSFVVFEIQWPRTSNFLSLSLEGAGSGLEAGNPGARDPEVCAHRIHAENSHRLREPEAQVGFLCVCLWVEGVRHPPHEVNGVCGFPPLIGREVNKLPTRGLP